MSISRFRSTESPRNVALPSEATGNLHALARGARRWLAAAALAVAGAGALAAAPGGAQLQTFSDATGVLGVANVNGATDTSNPFFQSLGTNGRSCASCHVASQGMSFSPASARARFAESGGRDPLFAEIDGANCRGAATGDAAAHSLILKNGLIRVGLTPPATAEFTISVVHDPYGCAITPDPVTGQQVVSVYRRPLPATNLRFLSAVMFDGRETVAPLTSGQSFAANLDADLSHQAVDATLGHAQAAQAPSSAQVSQIVSFELGLFTAQAIDSHAGRLSIARADGGPMYLSAQGYFPGINDSLGKDPTGAPFNPDAMTIFSAWLKQDELDAVGAARAAIARGEALFNTFPITIRNVRGLNDNPAIDSPDSFVGHCTSCHDTPNVGNHSFPLPLDIGTAHSSMPGMETDPAIAAGVAELSMPDLPIYLIQGCTNPFAANGEPESFYTTDPGKALISGKCADFNRIKGPILRGLAARAPYFHNGAAATLGEAVNFYNQRFNMGLTDQQKADLVAFLNSL